MFLALLISYNY